WSTANSTVSSLRKRASASLSATRSKPARRSGRWARPLAVIARQRPIHPRRACFHRKPTHLPTSSGPVQELRDDVVDEQHNLLRKVDCQKGEKEDKTDACDGENTRPKRLRKIVAVDRHDRSQEDQDSRQQHNKALEQGIKGTFLSD